MRQCATIIILSLLLTITARAEQDCDQVLQQCDVAVQRLKALTRTQDEYIALLERQRDQAFKELKDRGDGGGSLPWYAWAVLGVAGGVILTRGLR